jgi:isoleucyl-tRNA synthetase
MLDNYDIYSPTREIERFVEDLSNWYVRRNRRRFWKSENDGDKRGAYATLYMCLATLARLLAPFMPFASESPLRSQGSPVSQRPGRNCVPRSLPIDRNPQLE